MVVVFLAFFWFCLVLCGFCVCLAVLFLLFCLFSVSFGVVLFPFAPVHALALSLTGAQRTDSTFASKKTATRDNHQISMSQMQ